jgi:hypothetical protein
VHLRQCVSSSCCRSPLCYTVHLLKGIHIVLVCVCVVCVFARTICEILLLTPIHICTAYISVQYLVFYVVKGALYTAIQTRNNLIGWAELRF